MKSPITLQLEDRVRHELASLSNALRSRAGRSLKRWIAEYALPRFCYYEERRIKRRKARIDREVERMDQRAREAVHVRALDDDEIREGIQLLDKLQTRGQELSEEEKAKVEETMAALLARRKMNRLHARALEEDAIREAMELADRLKRRGELSFDDEERVRQLLRG